MKKIKLDKNIVKSLRKFMVDNSINDYSYEENKFEIKILNPKEHKKEYIPRKVVFILIIWTIVATNDVILENIKVIDKWIIPFYIALFYIIWKIINSIYFAKIHKEKKVSNTIEKRKTEEYYNSDEKHNL